MCSVHKHLRATVWTEMMSKLQASKWFINKQNQSTEATRPATVSPPPPFAITLPVCPEANWWPLCGRRKAVGGYQQHLIKTQITGTSGQCKKLFLVYIPKCVCVLVCVCRSILEISSFQQHFRQLNHVRNEKWTCPRRMWPEQLGSGWCFGAIILTRLQAGASKIYNMT